MSFAGLIVLNVFHLLSGGSHLEVKKKSPLIKQVRTQVASLCSFVLLAARVGDVIF
jgi:hypothetical protein